MNNTVTVLDGPHSSLGVSMTSPLSRLRHIKSESRPIYTEWSVTWEVIYWLDSDQYSSYAVPENVKFLTSKRHVPSYTTLSNRSDWSVIIHGHRPKSVEGAASGTKLVPNSYSNCFNGRYFCPHGERFGN